MIHAHAIASRITLAMVGLGAMAALAMAPVAAQAQSAPVAPSPKTSAATGEGTYFPAATSRETVPVRTNPAENAGAQARRLFADQVNLITTSAERPIPIVAQAVGTEQKTLVFMNIEAHEFLTPYVARALLARMSSLARFLPEVTRQGLSADFDVYTLAAIIGFDRIVVTDGRKFSHEVLLAPAAS